MLRSEVQGTRLEKASSYKLVSTGLTMTGRNKVLFLFFTRLLFVWI